MKTTSPCVYIQDTLLIRKLGISDTNVYLELKSLIEKYVDIDDPITPKVLSDFLKNKQREFLLTQEFEVNKNWFVENNTLSKKLDEMLENNDGSYIIITGLPGSGKSTLLTVYFDNLGKSEKYHVIKYYCFVDINDNKQKLRIKGDSFVVNILTRLKERFFDLLERRFDYGIKHFYDSLELLGTKLSKADKKLVIFIDGLDHVEKAGTKIYDNVLEVLPKKIPEGILFVVSSQELHKWEPFLLESREKQSTHFEVPLFNQEQTKDYLVEKRNIQNLDEDLINQSHHKTECLPLY